MTWSVEDLVDDLEAEAEEALELRRSWNVAPTTDVPIVLERIIDGVLHRQVHVAKWGLVPGWAKDASVAVRSFNARSETVAEKPTFRAALKARRCAVPVEGYYEWKKFPGGKTKQPYFVHSSDGSLTTFAGLYEWWKDPSQPEGSPEQWLLSCTIITKASPEAGSGVPVLEELAGLHDRLPVPMDADALAQWLDPRATDPQALLAMVLAGADDVAAGWVVDPVGAEVGNVRNDSAELIKPIEDPLL